MADAMSVVRAGDGWECELKDGSLRVTVRVSDAQGALVVTGVEVTTDDPGGVSPSSLSRAPYARWIRAAKDAVAREGKSRPLMRANDVLLRPFLEDRRGGQPRTDVDFAQLAAVYVGAGASSRALARDLATRHGGSVQTWRNRLTEAKRFTCVVDRFAGDGEVVQERILTAEAMRLLYGDDYAAVFELQAARDSDYAGAARFIQLRETPRSAAERERALVEDRRRGPAKVERLLAEAHRVVRTYGQRHG